MKKYLLVSLTILFAAAFVWAEEAAPATPSVDVKADATLSWGIDLGKGGVAADKITHGFKNDASFNVKFPLIKKGDKISAKSDVPVYGEVSIKDIELKLLSEKDNKAFHLAGKVDDIEATLYFYGAYLTVYDKPDFTANYAQIWKPLVNDKKYKEDDYKIEPGFEGMGTKLGYTNENFMDLDVGLKLGSNGPWAPGEYPKKDEKTSYWKYFDGKTALDEGEYTGTFEPGEFPPEGNYFVTKLTPKDPSKAGKQKPSSKYGVGIDFSIKPLDKMLAVDLTVNSTLSKEYKDAGVNFGVKLTSEPMDGLKLKAAFDGGKLFEDNSTFEWDALISAEYKWVSGGVYAYSPDMAARWAIEKEVGGVKGLGYDPYFLSGYSFKNGKDITDVAFFLQFATKSDKKEASNLVEGLDAGVHLGIYNVLTFANRRDTGLSSKMQFPLLFKLWGSYKFNLNDASWIKPFASVWAETNYGLAMEVDVAKTAKNPLGKAMGWGTPSVGLAYELGLTYSPVEKVEVTAKWTHGTLAKNRYRSAIGTSAIGKNGHNGRFVLSLKLTY